PDMSPEEAAWGNAGRRRTSHAPSDLRSSQQSPSCADRACRNRMRAMLTIDLSGKTGLILGVANQRSLAWAISEKLAKAGARLAFTYQGERLQENVTALASRCDGALVMACDVTSDEQMDGVFNRLRREFGRLDYLVHSIAFARREDLEGDFRATT